MAPAKRRPSAPKRKKHLTGIQPKFAGGRWLWRARAKRDGHQHTGPLRESQEAAHRDYLELREKLHDPFARQRDVPALWASLDEFHDYCRKQRVTAKTLKNYERYVRYLKDAWPQDTYLDQLDRNALNAYPAFSAEQGRGADSCKKELNFLKRTFEFAQFPWPGGIKMPRAPKPARHYLEQDELMEVAAAMADWKPKRKLTDREKAVWRRDLAVLMLLGTTGIRAGEFLRLRVRDVNTRRREIRVVNAKNAAQVEVVLYGSHVVKHVEELIAQATDDGRLITSEAAYNYIWTRWRPRLGLDHLNGRVLRHTEGTRVLQDTGDLAAAQHRLRHTSIATTARYMHVEKEALRRAVQKQEERWTEFETRRASGESGSSAPDGGDPGT